MFKHSCYIENTEAARDHLRKLGYNLDSIFKSRFIKTRKDGKVRDYHFKNWIYSEEAVIDCTENIELFKALTAVRDDSDYMQWFIHDLCFFDESLEDRMVLCEKEDHKYLNVYTHFRKATKEELIGKYKK